MRGWLAARRHGRLVSRSLLTAIGWVLLTAAVVYASGGEAEGGHDSWAEWKDFGWRMLNFAVLAWFLWWMLAKKVKEFFVGRRGDISTALEDARRAKEEAEAKFRDYDARLQKATDEIDGITEMIRSQGEAEKARIVEDARKQAEKMKEDAQARMEQEFNKASSQLRLEAVKLSVELAEEILKKKITPQDHETMVRDYIDKAVKQN